jgi:transcriptional regulator with XRE-family HTH domain
MQSLGRILREEREKRGLSLDDLVKRTRISRKSLEALEADNAAALGSIFYFRSFAVQIGRVLQVDQNTVEWQKALASAVPVRLPEPAPPPPQPDTYIPRVRPLRPQRQSRWRSASPVVSFVVVLIACSGLYTVFDRFDLSDVPAFTNTAPGNPLNEFATKAPPQPILHRPEIAPDAILLKIAAVEKTWLAVDTDGKRIYSGLLDAEDTKELEGRATAKIKTGNAGGLTVIFNGKELGPLGERGQVRTVVFTPDQYQILGPSLTSRLQLLPAMSLPHWQR